MAYYVSTLPLSGANSRFLAPSRFPAFHLKCPAFFAYFDLKKCALCALHSVKWNSDNSATSFQCLTKLIRSAKSATYRYNLIVPRRFLYRPMFVKLRVFSLFEGCKILDDVLYCQLRPLAAEKHKQLVGPTLTEAV